MEKFLCKVNGRIAPGAMCGSVIVGMKYCGHKGGCEHKQQEVQAKEETDPQEENKALRDQVEAMRQKLERIKYLCDNCADSVLAREKIAEVVR